MKGWARARKLYLVAGTLFAVGIILRLGGQQPILVPSVLGGGGRALAWSTLVPLVWAAVVCAVFAGVRSDVEFRPSLRIVRLDAALLVFGTLAFWLTVAMLSPAATGTKYELLTHSVIMAGLASLLTTRWGEEVGIAVLVALVLVTLGYGPRNPGASFICFLAPGSDPVLSAGLALLTGALGVRSIVDRRRSVGR